MTLFNIISATDLIINSIAAPPNAMEHSRPKSSISPLWNYYDDYVSDDVTTVYERHHDVNQTASVTSDLIMPHVVDAVTSDDMTSEAADSLHASVIDKTPIVRHERGNYLTSLSQK